MPDSFEVWFLSPNKTSFIPEIDKTKFLKVVAENKICQKYGDYCFDPQIGLYKEDEKGEVVEIGEEAKELDPAQKVDEKVTQSVLDQSLIDCKKDNFFDLYCGKERGKVATKSNVDVWIDTSSSFKTYDPADRSGGCRRRSFAMNIQKVCGEKASLYSYNTQKTYQYNIDNFCNNHGLNDEKIMMRWIQESNAKHLIIITDITEYTSKFSDFITKNNGFIRGTEVEDIMTNEKMLELVSTVANYCKKK